MSSGVWHRAHFWSSLPLIFLVAFCEFPVSFSISFKRQFRNQATTSIEHLVEMLRGGEVVGEVGGDAVAPTAASDSLTNVIDIGGGAVNEKQRTYVPNSTADSTGSTEHETTSNFNPSEIKSHLYHAMEGLERYPNYLTRWSTNDIESLEDAIQKQLQKIQQQKQLVMFKGQLFSKITTQLRSKFQFDPPQTWDDVFQNVLDPRAASVIRKSRMFSKNNAKGPPTLQDVVAGQVSVHLDVAQLSELLDEDFLDIFAFPLLSEDFCATMEEYIQAFQELLQLQVTEPKHEQLRRVSSLDLDFMGFRWLNDLLFHLILQPISRHLFSVTETLGGDLDWRQGYIAAYSADPTQSKPRQRLNSHTDDSEVTLNVCIGSPSFVGGKLQFYGLRGTPDAGERTHGEGDAYTPQIGRAIVHAGRQLHEVTEVTDGDRFALIMWSRSWKGVRSERCPCCWLSRRQANPCICGRQWN